MRGTDRRSVEKSDGDLACRACIMSDWAWYESQVGFVVEFLRLWASIGAFPAPHAVLFGHFE